MYTLEEKLMSPVRLHTQSLEEMIRKRGVLHVRAGEIHAMASELIVLRKLESEVGQERRDYWHSFGHEA